MTSGPLLALPFAIPSQQTVVLKLLVPFIMVLATIVVLSPVLVTYLTGHYATTLLLALVIGLPAFWTLYFAFLTPGALLLAGCP